MDRDRGDAARPALDLIAGVRPASTSGACHQPAAQPAGARPEIRLETRLGPSQPAAPLREGEPVAGRAHRPERVPQAMLPDLRELDRGHDGGPPRSCGKAGPGLGGLVPAAEAAQEMGPFDRDPVRGPGRRKGGGAMRWGGPDVGASPAPEVGRHLRRPPRDLADDRGPAAVHVRGDRDRLGWGRSRPTVSAPS